MFISDLIFIVVMGVKVYNIANICSGTMSKFYVLCLCFMINVEGGRNQFYVLRLCFMIMFYVEGGRNLFHDLRLCYIFYVLCGRKQK